MSHKQQNDPVNGFDHMIRTYGELCCCDLIIKQFLSITYVIIHEKYIDRQQNFIYSLGLIVSCKEWNYLCIAVVISVYAH